MLENFKFFLIFAEFLCFLEDLEMFASYSLASAGTMEVAKNELIPLKKIESVVADFGPSVHMDREENLPTQMDQEKLNGVPSQNLQMSVRSELQSSDSASVTAQSIPNETIMESWIRRLTHLVKNHLQIGSVQNALWSHAFKGVIFVVPDKLGTLLGLHMGSAMGFYYRNDGSWTPPVVYQVESETPIQWGIDSMLIILVATEKSKMSMALPQWRCSLSVTAIDVSDEKYFPKIPVKKGRDPGFVLLSLKDFPKKCDVRFHFFREFNEELYGRKLRAIDIYFDPIELPDCLKELQNFLSSKAWNCRSYMRLSKECSKGFFLLEVVVALAIFAISATVISHSFTNGLCAKYQRQESWDMGDKLLFLVDQIFPADKKTSTSDTSPKEDMVRNGVFSFPDQSTWEWNVRYEESNVLGLYKITLDLMCPRLEKKVYEFYRYIPQWCSEEEIEKAKQNFLEKHAKVQNV